MTNNDLPLIKLDFDTFINKLKKEEEKNLEFIRVMNDSFNRLQEIDSLLSIHNILFSDKMFVDNCVLEHVNEMEARVKELKEIRETLFKSIHLVIKMN